MGYKLDNKDIDISLVKQSKLANGQTGDVYKYKDTAIKIFKESKIPPIDEKTAKYLTTITTDRILLPKKLLFYNNAFKGYSFKLVSRIGTGKKLILLPKEELVENIVLLEEDIKILSSKKILLNGLIPDNCIYNGELFITDPSKYALLEVCREDDLERLNKYQLHLLLTELISIELKKDKQSSDIRRHMKELLKLKDDDEDSSKFITDILDNSENIKSFVKKL